MSDEKLDVRTRCILSAGAVMALTGITPAIIWRPGSDPVFQFPSEAEPALQLYLQSKDRLERMVDEIVVSRRLPGTGRPAGGCGSRVVVCGRK